MATIFYDTFSTVHVPPQTLDQIVPNIGTNYSLAYNSSGRTIESIAATSSAQPHTTGSGGALYTCNTTYDRTDYGMTIVIYNANGGESTESMVLRYTDASNFYCVLVSGKKNCNNAPGRLDLYRVKAGVVTCLVGPYFDEVLIDDIVEFRAINTNPVTLECRVNGTLMWAYDDSSADRITSIGTAAFGMGATFTVSPAQTMQSQRITTLSVDNVFQVIPDTGVTLGGSALCFLVANGVVGTGGFTLGGEALTAVKFSYTSTGGLTLGGDALASTESSYTGTGGFTLGGTALALASAYGTTHYTGTGGLTLGGTATTLAIASVVSYTGSGGLTLGGTALALASAYGTTHYTGTGGLTLGGTALEHGTTTYTGTGGLTIGGTASTLLVASVIQYTGSGGLTIDGSALALASAYGTTTYTGTGGLTIGGIALEHGTTTYTGSGGLTIGGTALALASSYGITHYTGSGSITLSGAALTAESITYSSSGGIVIGGSAVASTPLTDFSVLGTGGFTLSGEATAAFDTLHYTFEGNDSYVGGGSLFLGGNSYYRNGDNWVFEATGGITLSSNILEPIPVSVAYLVDFSIQWNINSDLTIDREFEWDSGEVPLYWYRVEGVCAEPSCETTATDFDQACATQQVRLIAARGLRDLCDRLHEDGLAGPWTGRIASIRRFSRPVSKAETALQESLGINHDCNVLIDEGFCTIPECLDYCLDEDVVVECGMEAILLDQFFTYVATGGLQLMGSAFSEQVMPNYTADDTPITLGGEAIVTISNFIIEVGGGLVISGEAIVISTAYGQTGDGALTIGGEALVTSTAFRMVASGGITLTGTGEDTISYHYVGVNVMQLTGEAEVRQGLLFVSSGSTITIGSSATVLVSSYTYVSSGGLTVAGAGRIRCNRFYYTASGGLTLDGYGLIKFKYVASGGITLAGQSLSQGSSQLSGAGGLTLGGSAIVVSGSWAYTASGGLSLGGVALDNDLGILDIEMGMDSFLEAIAAIYPLEEDTGLTITTGTASTTCGCFPLPLELQMTHNFGDSNKLKDFLRRNRLSLPATVPLLFGDMNDSWRKIYHFTGVGENDTQERWKIIFEWSCVTEIGGLDLGTAAWRFSAFLNKVNVTAGEDFDTRVLLAFPIDPPCFSASVLKFAITLDTLTEFVVTNPNSAVETVILYDEIGLFKNKFWTSNPNLKINVSSVGVKSAVPRYDLEPIFPEQPLLTI